MKLINMKYIYMKMIWLFLVFEAFLEVVSSGTTQGWVHPIVLIWCSYQACSQSFNYQTNIIAILNHKLVKCVLDFLGCPVHHKRDVETWSCTNCTTCKGLFSWICHWSLLLMHYVSLVWWKSNLCNYTWISSCCMRPTFIQMITLTFLVLTFYKFQVLLLFLFS
jgi:hypothetical protein